VLEGREILRVAVVLVLVVEIQASTNNNVDVVEVVDDAMSERAKVVTSIVSKEDADNIIPWDDVCLAAMASTPLTVRAIASRSVPFRSV